MNLEEGRAALARLGRSQDNPDAVTACEVCSTHSRRGASLLSRDFDPTAHVRAELARGMSLLATQSLIDKKLQ
jgi:hypothetical protein